MLKIEMGKSDNFFDSYFVNILYNLRKPKI